MANEKNNSSSAKISVFTLAMINVAAIVSLRGLPAEAEYGLTSIFYYLFAATFFLIPLSLVAAEMGSSWTEKGGVFRWVGEAFGPAWGFLAIFLQWLQSTIWFPTVLTFAAVSLAFINIDQHMATKLSANPIYTVCVVLIVYWLATLMNFRGIKFSGAISKWGVILGTLVPGVLLIVFGIAYIATGHPVYLNYEGSFFPDFTSFDSLSLAVSIFLFYAGMEMSSVHVKDIKNPQRNYPLAILLAAVITVILFIFGTLAVAIVIPGKYINLTQSLLLAYDKMFDALGVRWFGLIVALFLTFGVYGQVSTWIAGPSKGILSVGKAGYLPLWLQKTNKYGIQVNILTVQGFIVTILSVMFVMLPSVQAAYQILSALTITLYLIMYMLMFLAFFKLRFSQPNVTRYFKVPWGSFGMWLFGGIGFLGSLLAFILAFFPPSQIEAGSSITWVLLLIAGNIIGVAVPFIIYACRKPSWNVDGADFAPFAKDARHAATNQELGVNPYLTQANEYANQANHFAVEANDYIERANQYADKANEYAQKAQEFEESHRREMSTTEAFASDTKPILADAKNKARPTFENSRTQDLDDILSTGNLTAT